MDERTLLVVAAKAIEEHVAWKARNSARKALRTFYRNYSDETGERFDRDDCIAGGMHEDAAAFDAVSNPAKEAQQKLTSARAATRRAIVRAAAAIGEKMP